MEEHLNALPKPARDVLIYGYPDSRGAMSSNPYSTSNGGSNGHAIQPAPTPMPTSPLPTTMSPLPGVNGAIAMSVSGLPRTASGSMLDVSMEERGKKMVVSMVLEEEHLKSRTKKRSDGTERPSRTQVSHLLSSVYAICMVAFGILFPMTEALQDIWLQSIPNGIFLMYNYVLATAFLIYLQCFLLEPEHEEEDVMELPGHHTDPMARGDNTAPPGITFSHMTPSPSDGDFKLVSSGRAIENGGPGKVTRSPQPDTKRPRHVSTSSVMSGVNEQGYEYTVSLDLFKSMFEHEGSSFYLRLGTLMFAIGNLIYIGLELEYHLSDHVPKECNDAVFGWTFIFRLIFIIVQSFFIFKNPKVHVVRQKPLVRFGFMHLIATNLCIWIRTLTSEIRNEILHSQAESGNASGHSLHGVTGSYADDAADGLDCSVYREQLGEISLYLFPFVMEYSLIATGTMAVMNYDISSGEHHDVMANIKQVLNSCGQTVQTLGVPGMPSYVTNNPTSTSNQVGALFRKAHRGTFMGFVLMAGMFVSTILFFFTDSAGDGEEAQMIYLVSDIVLHLFIIIAVILCFFQTSKLSFVSKGISIDDTLLLLAMSGSFFFEMSLMISTSTYLADDSPEVQDSVPERHIIVLSLISSILAGTHTILQLLLILAGLRKYSATKENLQQMPGRGTITFLIIGNITLWVFRTVQVKEVEMGIQEQFYGQLAWLFIMSLCLPLQLFFFFHSSVCFADIWSMAYKPVQARYHLVHHSPSQFSIDGLDNPSYDVRDADLKARMDAISEHHDDEYSLTEENHL